jgi:hypothetical protein
VANAYSLQSYHSPCHIIMHSTQLTALGKDFLNSNVLHHPSHVLPYSKVYLHFRLCVCLATIVFSYSWTDLAFNHLRKNAIQLHRVTFSARVFFEKKKTALNSNFHLAPAQPTLTQPILFRWQRHCTHQYRTPVRRPTIRNRRRHHKSFWYGRGFAVGLVTPLFLPVFIAIYSNDLLSRRSPFS